MSMVYRYNNYSDWIAAKHEARSEKRSVAVVNTGLYSGWGSIALCRAGAFVEAITAFFRTHTPFTLTAPVALTDLRQTCSHVGLALSTVVSMAEMAVTCFIFGKDAHHYRRLGNHLDAHRRNHQAYAHHISDIKDAAHEAKESNANAPRGTVRCAVLPPQSPSIDIRATPSHSASTTEDMATLAKSFLEYEVGQVELPEATSTFKRSLVMFLRDGPFQGGAVGCNLALLWQGFKVSDLLHIATTPINAVATAIGGAAFGAACGALHIIGGALARSEGLQKLAAATRAKDAIETAIARIQGVKEERRAEVEEAAEIGATLLQHAAHNEESAKKAARNQIVVGNWRIGYGSTAIAIAGVSLAFFLVAGGLSTGGLIFALGGALVLAAWVGYAAYRNGKDAATLKDATAAATGNPPAMTLDLAIERAVEYLDRTDGTGKDNREGRRLIKRALLDIGMRRSDFWALRFCATEPGVKDPVVDTLKVLIRNQVDGDGARRALHQGPAAKTPVKESATP